MSHVSRVRCCVLGCSATYQSTDQSGEKVRFFGFPSRPHEIERRSKWIENIRTARKDLEGIWAPSKNSKVCSRHFVGNVKVENPREPNYNPTVFPTLSKKTAQKYNRIYTAKAAQRNKTKSVLTAPKVSEIYTKERNAAALHHAVTDAQYFPLHYLAYRRQWGTFTAAARRENEGTFLTGLRRSYYRSPWWNCCNGGTEDRAFGVRNRWRR